MRRLSSSRNSALLMPSISEALDCEIRPSAYPWSIAAVLTSWDNSAGPRRNAEKSAGPKSRTPCVISHPRKKLHLTALSNHNSKKMEALVAYSCHCLFSFLRSQGLSREISSISLGSSLVMSFFYGSGHPLFSFPGLGSSLMMKKGPEPKRETLRGRTLVTGESVPS